MAEIWISAGIGAILGIIFYFLITRPKLKKVQEYNSEIEQRNKEIQQQNVELNSQHIILTSTINELQIKVTQETEQYNSLLSKQETLRGSITTLEEQAQNASDIFYQEKMKLAETHFANNTEKLANEYKELKSSCENEYLSLLEQEAIRFKETLKQNKEELKKLQKELDDKKRAVQAAIEEAKRQQELEEKEEFYKIKLSDIDREEIARLRTVVPYLRSAEPINKVIWSVYYMNPLNDLIGRVIGKNSKCGIYKISNIKNKKVYIGQSADVIARWKQHVKRGVGAETPTRNKLYPEMNEYGPESFTFELLEECPRNQLDEREKYWIEYFDSYTWGYNATSGNNGKK